MDSISHASIFCATVDRAFETEINCSNPLGTGGRLAIGFAVLLRALWKGTHHAFQPSKLKVPEEQPEIPSSSQGMTFWQNMISILICPSLLSCVPAGHCGQ